MNRYVGNLPPMPVVFPDYPAEWPIAITTSLPAGIQGGPALQSRWKAKCNQYPYGGPLGAAGQSGGDISGKLICADQSLSYIRVDLHAVGRNDDAERSVLQP